MKKKIDAVLRLLSGQPLARFSVLRSIARVLYPSYRFKWPQMDWWDNAEFTAYLERFEEEDGMNSDRRWMLGQLQRLTTSLVGDTAECGVYRGAASHLICRQNTLSPTPKTHFMFDSFEGLSKPSARDGSHWKAGDLHAGITEVNGILLEYPEAAVIMKGWIPTRFSDVSDRTFSFVHIDVDLYQPTRDTIEFFYPRMLPGGIIVCDDYGFTTCPGATDAIDEFLKDKPEKMISLCSGGGFMIRGCKTSVGSFSSQG